ncbi:Leu/Phe/Val dehydrogenase [Parageobacillus thermoglucosidasius]|uniref:Leucine dehydrogenase n=2 Tax=Anoxybacillaceae TaxID=3120669 RepID=A0AAN0YPX7_PARTM|nr:Glu/Leu/Phe/Val dehydrogenase [Parageobacillus thermoglucosidasius]REK58215.1 MAG: Glu/Leu/Phe/Val dehydrogenase [Geobacillus sp.]AEH47572.1 Phenylalanine dehydrogenase [Parageobacillus thermoglucosidasius C56-YS93]ALF11191.1 leucine dehydrogenase [Parageobacillus thermoglucosidasius]ANZ31267.1 leucine dehydrogenase [Parageobacillus thermoglucosidasius]APM82005.1 leucine dehydrogenase [Parageobacillus thermoglucosidasius]
MNTVTNQWKAVDIFTQIRDHEQVVFCNDKNTGLKAIIAIHDTTLGPALGGCRMYPYATVEDALFDVLRLSKGMTYKCLAADVDFGGGKAVIIGDPHKDKTPELFRAFGQFVESLNGRFYTGTDMGTTPDDFVHAMKETNCIVGVPEEYGGSGDSSVPTALGVIYGIQATNKVIWGSDELHGKTYAIQGLGKVGRKVAERLLKEGADLYVCDIHPTAIEAIVSYAKKLGANVKVVQGTEIYRTDADIFVPCAFGNVVNDNTIHVLKVKAIVGSANNQLLDVRHGQLLKEKGILYAPDYIVNAGGLIQVADELYGLNKERVLQKTKAIYSTLLHIYSRAEADHITTIEAANRFCEERLQQRSRRNDFFTHRKQPKWDIRR